VGSLQLLDTVCNSSESKPRELQLNNRDVCTNALWKYIIELSSENISVENVVTYSMVQSWALKMASNQCIQAEWIHDQAIKERKSI
jgi:hypothetical protein